MNIDHTKLIEDSSTFFIKLMVESNEKLEEAWEGALAEAELQETAPKLRVGFTVIIDVEKHKAEYVLSFAVRHKRTIEAELPDPNQRELPITPESRHKLAEAAKKRWAKGTAAKA